MNSHGRVTRRALLRVAGGGALGVAGVGRAAADEREEPPEGTPDGSEVYRPKIRTVRRPLAAVPTVLAGGETLRVELDPDGPLGGDVERDLAATLRPSFGGAAVPVDLELTATTTEGSDLWPDRQVLAAAFRVPETGSGLRPDLYDLHVSWAGGADHQPRAVRVYDTVPAELDVVAIADPQVGDPRAMQSGAEESRRKGSPDPFVRRTTETVGPEGRWNAFRQVVREVNLADPDVVLVAGDLTLGQDVPGKYYAEYEEAYRLLNQVRAPTYTVLGNHDGYVQSGTDGKALYRETFAPFYYSVDVGDAHLVALDTYDWSYLDRMGTSVAVSTYGGQVRDEQRAWLEDDIGSWRADNPDGSVVALCHHNPSWLQDPHNRFYDEAEGTPVAEQFARGSRYPESGQLWTGENRLAVRGLFREQDVALCVSGHSHRDRLARAVGDGDVVETPGPNCFPAREYHYVADVAADDPESHDCYPHSGGRLVEEYTQSELAEMLVDPSEGPLYAGVTTVASSTDEYWGLRPFVVDGDGVDPRDGGYPMTDDFLAERAVAPDHWSPDHDAVGLYAHPSYLLSVETREQTDRKVKLRVENARATPVEGAVVVTLADCESVSATGGRVVWRRRGDDRQDVKVAFAAAAADDDPAVVDVEVACD